MVKSLTAIGVATALLFGLALFEWFYVERQFDGFGEELESLCDKVDAETASQEDARIVQTRWEKRKEKLYVWVPHNDISRFDEYMAESVRLIGEEQYSLARAKLEVLLLLAERLPGTYRPRIENIF